MQTIYVSQAKDSLSSPFIVGLAALAAIVCHRICQTAQNVLATCRWIALRHFKLMQKEDERLCCFCVLLYKFLFQSTFVPNVDISAILTKTDKTRRETLVFFWADPKSLQLGTVLDSIA